MESDIDTEFDDCVVKVIAGRYKGRVAYADCVDFSMPKHYVVYFGRMVVAPHYYYVQKRYLSLVTTPDLLERQQQIGRQIKLKNPKISYEEQADILSELNLIETSLYERMMQTQYNP